MALIILEGLDRTGKSTVASYYQAQGYELVHMSAPPKGTTYDDYMQDMTDLIASAATKDIIFDRSHYGELVWPEVYGRKPIITADDFEHFTELENSVGVYRIFMHDRNLEAHWKRCVDNKEPLTKAQFNRARSLFSQMAHKYNFESVTLDEFYKKFPDAKDMAVIGSPSNNADDSNGVASTGTSPEVNPAPVASYAGKTKEQTKLERANAINDILSKRILKAKGQVYDELENELRFFLNSKLGTLLGEENNLQLTSEEVKFYKAMFKKAMNK